MTRVGFVGAGRMGAPMVRRLAEAGHDVRVLGRTPEKCAAIQDLGAQAVTDLAAMAEDAEAVVVCVFTDDQVQQLCLRDGLVAAMAPEAVLIVHTTGSPRTAEAIAARGVTVIDAPVSGGPHDIAAGRVTLFVGGDDGPVARALPLLSTYGDPVLHVGGLGAGQLVKLINNALFAAQIGVVAEGVRLGGLLGVSEPTLLEALTHGSAASRALGNIARAGSTTAFIDAVGDFIGKDVAVVRETVAELGGDLGALNDMVDAGLNDETHCRECLILFSENAITDMVTTQQPFVTLQPISTAEEEIMTKPKLVFGPVSRSTSTTRTRSTGGCATRLRSTTTKTRTSMR